MKSLDKFKNTFNRIELSIISLSVNKNKVSDKLKEYFPKELENMKEKKKKRYLISEEHNFEGDLGEKKVKISYTIIKKYSHKIFYNIIKRLNKKEIKKLKDDLHNRLDDKNYLYLRLDKREWFLNNKHSLTDNGNCLHIKCHIQTYPAKKSLAEEEFNKFIKKFNE